MTKAKIYLAFAAVLALGAPLAVVSQQPAAAQTAARLNPNTATPAQLAQVKGLTPALVTSIQQNRPFASTAAFNAHLTSGGLTAEQTAVVYPQLFVPIKLNSSTAEEIALIPGMTRRMVREFLEYRPYENMEEFNREIGKYVDAAEVARLRSYVTLN